MTQSLLIQNTLHLLADLGVREICLAAGARNAPVIAALLSSQNIRLWNFFEERSAAFFALGRILATHRPVAVLTTSGTAAAELLPAVIEAYYQALPLLALTADRPKHYRGTGAPQSIEQPGLFGPYTPHHWDLDLHSPPPTPPSTLIRAPLHLNLCLDEPLSTDAPGIDFDRPARLAPDPPAATLTDLTPFTHSPRPVTLASGLNPDDAAQLKPLLCRLRAPILAETTSNLWSPPLLDSDLALLLHPATDSTLLALDPTHVLRLGSVPTTRWWRDLEDRPDIPVINISRAPFPGLARRQNVSNHPWSALSQLAAESCASPPPPPRPRYPFHLHPRSEPSLLHTLLQSLTPSSQVFLGNSLPIREANLAAAPLPPAVHFHANRGANGIDGITSTWLGLGATQGADSWLILGDLSALYDLAGPWVLPQLEPRRRFLVILNNGGGKIFSLVPTLRSLPPDAHALIENQHTLSFKPFADLWNLTHTPITDPSQFPALLDYPAGTHLVEVLPDPAQTRAFWAASS